jgi:hypothetical protein
MHRRDRVREGKQKLECGGYAHCAGMNIEFLHWPGSPREVDWGGVKRTRRNKPIKVATHTCMETTQGICLCSYIHLILAKTSCFLFSSFMLFLQNWRTGGQNRFCGRVWRKVAPVGRVVVGKGVGG